MAWHGMASVDDEVIGLAQKSLLSDRDSVQPQIRGYGIVR
jgi:hypothetical protein